MGLENIRMVEFEPDGFCNRTCGWCPNSTINRRQKDLSSNVESFETLLKDLKKHNAGKNSPNGLTISFSRYNEPLSKDAMLKTYTELVREHLPDTRVVFNTNGDYLKPGMLENIAADEVSIMDYDNKGFVKCFLKLKKLGANPILPRHGSAFINGNVGKTKVLYYVDWQKHHEIEDRGGLLSACSGVEWRNNKEKRTAPCMEPTYFIAIDYNGNVLPCCNMRSDAPSHKPFVLGNIKETSIDEIFNSQKANSFRGVMASGDSKKYSSPCQNCQKPPGRYTKDNGGIKYE